MRLISLSFLVLLLSGCLFSTKEILNIKDGIYAYQDTLNPGDGEDKVVETRAIIIQNERFTMFYCVNNIGQGVKSVSYFDGEIVINDSIRQNVASFGSNQYSGEIPITLGDTLVNTKELMNGLVLSFVKINDNTIYFPAPNDFYLIKELNANLDAFTTLTEMYYERFVKINSSSLSI